MRKRERYGRSVTGVTDGGREPKPAIFSAEKVSEMTRKGSVTGVTDGGRNEVIEHRGFLDTGDLATVPPA